MGSSHDCIRIFTFKSIVSKHPPSASIPFLEKLHLEEADGQVAVGIEGGFQQVVQALEPGRHTQAAHAQHLQAPARLA